MRLYGKYLAMLLKTQLVYKASFAMTVVGQFLVSFTAFLGVYFLYDRFHEVEGYSFAEVLLCFAVTLTAFSLAECFAREFGKYPFSVYGEGVLKLLTYVVPLALFQYYPLLYILGRSADVRLLLLPLAGFVFFVPCYAFFRLGLRKYKSTGS